MFKVSINVGDNVAQYARLVDTDIKRFILNHITIMAVEEKMWFGRVMDFSKCFQRMTETLLATRINRRLTHKTEEYFLVRIRKIEGVNGLSIHLHKCPADPSCRLCNCDIVNQNQWSIDIMIELESTLKNLCILKIKDTVVDNNRITRTSLLGTIVRKICQFPLPVDLLETIVDYVISHARHIH